MKRILNICFLIFTLYGIAHLYVFLKVRYVFHLDTVAGTFLGLFLLGMFLFPVIILVYTSRYIVILSRALAHISYLWVALLILFSSTAVLIELYNLIIRSSGLFQQGDFSGALVPPLPSFFIPLFFSAAFTIYGYFEARNLRVEKLVLKTSKLPDGINKLTIAQISDLHLGIINRDKSLDKIIKKIEHLNPDLIVSTGDLLDGVVSHVDHLAQRLKKIHAKIGKFAVIGNHELMGDITKALNFTIEAGFTLLRGQGITVQNLINIAGVDDPDIHIKNNGHKSEKEILSCLPADKFTLLLKHRPDIDKESLGMFDLQLSGHTHKGQIFPVSLITRFTFCSRTGFSTLSKGSAIYVSRGAGTVGPPVRFFTPPEITIIEVLNDKNHGSTGSPSLAKQREI